MLYISSAYSGLSGVCKVKQGNFLLSFSMGFVLVLDLAKTCSYARLVLALEASMSRCRNAALGNLAASLHVNMLSTTVVVLH